MHWMLQWLELTYLAPVVSFFASVVGVPLAVIKLRDMGLSRRARVANAGLLLVQRIDQDAHPLVVQLSFNTLFARRLSVEEIKALLAMANPLDMAEMRLAYSEAVEFVDGKFEWQGMYRKEIFQKYAKNGFYLLYFFFAFPFFFLLFSDPSEIPTATAWFLFVISIWAVWRGTDFSQIAEFMRKVDEESGR